MDNGGTLVGAAADIHELKNLFKEKMNFLSTCSNSTNCNSYPVINLDGSPDSYIFDYNLILSDGTIIKFAYDSATCEAPYNYVYGTGECGWMLVDVNGSRNPNQWGKDIYGIWILKNQILPWGANPVGKASGAYRENTCSSLDTGYGCGAKYLYN